METFVISMCGNERRVAARESFLSLQIECCVIGQRFQRVMGSRSFSSLSHEILVHVHAEPVRIWCSCMHVGWLERIILSENTSRFAHLNDSPRNSNW